MKKILLLSLLFPPSLFSMIDEINVQKENAPQKPVLSWGEKKNKLQFLYSLLEHGKDNTETIKDIKIFHQNYLIKYDDYGYGGCCPLAYALASGETDFALFLLNDQKVNPTKIPSRDYYAFDYFVRGIKDDSFSSQQNAILTLLIKNGCNINALNCDRRTPLAEYFFTVISFNTKHRFSDFDSECNFINKQKRLLNTQLINHLFDHGGCIFCNPSNVLHTIVHHSANDCNSSYKTFSAIATLFGSRLVLLRKFYVDRLLIFYALNKLRAHNKMDKVPKPLIHLFINMAMQYEDAFHDIKESVSHKQITSVSVMDNSYRYIETIRYKEVQKELTPCELVEHSKHLSTSAKLLVPIITPNFWTRPFKECLQEFNNVIDRAHTQKEESKKQQKEFYERIKKERKGGWVN